MAFQISTALEKVGYNVAVSPDIFDSLTILSKGRPQLVIMVKRLPYKKCECDFLRFRRVTEVPIIVIGERDDAADTLESGADAYLYNPVSMIELVAMVHSLLRNRKDRLERGIDKRWPGIAA
jgi:two-component system response regulator AdeR